MTAPEHGERLAAIAALYALEADRIAKSLAARRALPDAATSAEWAVADAKAQAYANAAEVVTGADAFEVARWVAEARARLEAVLAGSDG